MATNITHALRQIKDDLDSHVTPEEIQEACRACGHQWRDRILGPVQTVQMLLLQILHATAMTGVSRLAGQSFSASAYCQALQRLPVAVMRTLLRQFVARRRANTAEVARWHGLRVFLTDGSSCSMPDTPALQKRFEQPTEQKPGCGFPVAHLLTLFDAYTGMLVDVLASSWRIHDLKRVGELHPHLGVGDLLVADRGFCSFAHLAMLLGQGVHAVIRRHGKRPVSFAKKQYTFAGVDWPVRLGCDDQLVIWRKSSVPSRVLSREADDALPEVLVLRELRYRVTRRGYRTRRVMLVTTLLEAKTYPPEDLAALYHRRWQVEVNLRHMKETLGMRVLRSRTEPGVERELLAFALVYNVVCSVMTIIALHLETSPERISLIDTLRLLRVGISSLTTAAIECVPHRPGRVQPRVVKRRPLQYSRMTRPRHVLMQEIMKGHGTN